MARRTGFTASYGDIGKPVLRATRAALPEQRKIAVREFSAHMLRTAGGSNGWRVRTGASANGFFERNGDLWNKEDYALYVERRYGIAQRLWDEFEVAV